MTHLVPFVKLMFPYMREHRMPLARGWVKDSKSMRCCQFCLPNTFGLLHLEQIQDIGSPRPMGRV